MCVYHIDHVLGATIIRGTGEHALSINNIQLKVHLKESSCYHSEPDLFVDVQLIIHTGTYEVYIEVRICN